MNYFIRFSESIEVDIERMTSILTNHDNLIIDGLCAFYGGETIEEAHKKANFWGKHTADNGDTYCILTGRETNGKKGTLGTVIVDAKLVSKHKILIN
jgi:hypothetical protein